MRWREIARLLPLLLPPLLAGCGSGQPTPEEAAAVYDKAQIEEVAELYRGYVFEFKKPPGKAADFARFEVAFPNGYRQVRDKETLIYWGAPLSDDASDTVLAYEKKVPEEGGLVLMQDGKTIEPMTAEQFAAAPKAPGKLEEPSKKG